jgi:Transglycosylase SLT domain
MNKVNLILLIIAMFTGFPAIVAVSQNISVSTPSEAYFSQSSSIVVQTTPSNSILSSSEAQSSSSLILSTSSVAASSLTTSSSAALSSSSSEKSKAIEALPLIVVKPISSAKVVVQDVKKLEIPKIIPKVEPKPIVKTELKQETKPEVKVESSVSSAIEPKVIIPIPIIVSSSSQVLESSSEVVKPKANLTFAEQITARCEVVGCNAAQLIRVMKCESSGNPTVVGAGLYIGLFQFLPSTFNAYKVKAGFPNGDIYNGSDQIHVATYMFANGQASQWGCK